MRKRASQYLLMLGLAILFPAVVAVAAASKTERGNAVSKDAAKFLTKAKEGGMLEVKLGQLAEDKASSEKVREFGQRMVKDHSATDEALTKLAEKKDVEVPKDLHGEQKATVDRLSKLSGKEFNREYMRTMVEEHKKDIKEFKEEARQAEDPDVKEFAAKHVPVLLEHLHIAQSIAREVGASVAQRQSSR